MLAAYASGELAGGPAITRRDVGRGSAAYVSTRLGVAGLEKVLGELLAAADVTSELPVGVRGRVELAIRTDGESEFWVLVNRTTEPLDISGLTGELVSATPGEWPVLQPRGVAVLRREPTGR